MRATDKAVDPPNTWIWPAGGDQQTLSFPARKTGRTEDVTGISIVVKETPHGIDRSNLSDAKTHTESETRIPLADEAVDGDTVEARVAFTLRASVFRGRCTSGGIDYEATVAELGAGSRVTFDKVLLTPDLANELHLEFVDPVENWTLVRKLTVHPDTTPPQFEITLISNGQPNPEYHNVASGTDISIQVKSNETLSGVVASFTRRPELTYGLTKRQDEFVLDSLATFELAEGNHTLKLTAHDVAGNTASREQEILVNPHGPELDFQAESKSEPSSAADAEGEKLQLGGAGKLLFTLSDLNGIKLDEAVVTAHFDGRQRVVRLPYERSTKGRYRIQLESAVAAPNPQSVLCSIRMPDFRRPVSGWFSASIPDLQGRDQGEKKWTFELRPYQNWEEVVEWEGIKWVRFLHRGKWLFISRSEISNQLYNNEDLFDNSVYKDSKLREEYERPRFWTKSGVPEYLVEGESSDAPQEFPVVGVSPQEAEAFAKLFGARLPNYSEWLTAARLDNPHGRYPWPESEKGKKWCNYYRSRDENKSSLAYSKTMVIRGKESAVHVVDVNSGPPFSDSKVLHQVGNVGELVRFDGTDDYGIAGDSFDVAYEDMNLDRTPIPYESDELHRNLTTGFRLLIDVADKRALQAFRDEARK